MSELKFGEYEAFENKEFEKGTPWSSPGIEYPLPRRGAWRRLRPGARPYYVADPVLRVPSRLARWGMLSVRISWRDANPVAKLLVDPSPRGWYALWWLQRNPLQFSADVKTADDPDWRRVYQRVEVVVGKRFPEEPSHPGDAPDFWVDDVLQ